MRHLGRPFFLTILLFSVGCIGPSRLMKVTYEEVPKFEAAKYKSCNVWIGVALPRKENFLFKHRDGLNYESYIGFFEEYENSVKSQFAVNKICDQVEYKYIRDRSMFFDYYDFNQLLEPRFTDLLSFSKESNHDANFIFLAKDISSIMKWYEPLVGLNFLVYAVSIGIVPFYAPWEIQILVLHNSVSEPKVTLSDVNKFGASLVWTPWFLTGDYDFDVGFDDTNRVRLYEASTTEALSKSLGK